MQYEDWGRVDVAGSKIMEVHTLKGTVIFALSLVLLLVLIPGCFTFQTQPSSVTPPSGTASVIGTFSSNPATINPGETTTLMWNVTGANSVSIDNGIGQVSAVGARVISPVVSTVYTISATNSAGTVTRSSVTNVNSAPLPPAPVSFAVTGVTANIDPATFTGACPKTFTFYASVTANDAGTVTYRWERNDGKYSDPQSITFYGAGTKTAMMQWDMSGTSSGWYRVHVLSPNDTASNMVNYILDCGGASMVTSIVMSVDPNTYSGACPATVNFWAAITSSGPGAVTYRWERSDNATAMTPQTIIFTAAGTQTIATTWTRGGGTGWQRLHVLTPNDAVSSPIGFTLVCVP